MICPNCHLSFEKDNVCPYCGLVVSPSKKEDDTLFADAFSVDTMTNVAGATDIFEQTEENHSQSKFDLAYKYLVIAFMSLISVLEIVRLVLELLKFNK